MQTPTMRMGGLFSYQTKQGLRQEALPDTKNGCQLFIYCLSAPKGVICLLAGSMFIILGVLFLLILVVRHILIQLTILYTNLLNLVFVFWLYFNWYKRIFYNKNGAIQRKDSTSPSIRWLNKMAYYTQQKFTFLQKSDKSWLIVESFNNLSLWITDFLKKKKENKEKEKIVTFKDVEALSNTGNKLDQIYTHRILHQRHQKICSFLSIPETFTNTDHGSIVSQTTTNFTFYIEIQRAKNSQVKLEEQHSWRM